MFLSTRFKNISERWLWVCKKQGYWLTSASPIGFHAFASPWLQLSSSLVSSVPQLWYPSHIVETGIQTPFRWHRKKPRPQSPEVSTTLIDAGDELYYNMILIKCRRIKCTLLSSSRSYVTRLCFKPSLLFKPLLTIIFKLDIRTIEHN